MSRFGVPKIGWNELGANLYALVTPVANTYIPAVLGTTLAVGLMTVLLNLLLLTSNLGVAWFGGASGRVQDLAIALTIGMFTGGVFFVLLIYYGANAYIAIPSRYGLSLLPGAVGVLAWAASRRRWGGSLLLAVGVLNLFVVLRVLL